MQIHWLKWVGLSGFPFVISLGIGLATGTSWQEAIETGNKLYEQGHYPEAERAYQEALAEAEEWGREDPRLASTENGLALVCQALGKYSEAEALYLRVWATLEKTPTADHLDLRIVAKNLAELYRLTGQFNKAEPLYQRSLAFKEKRFGPNHPLVATSLDGFGLFCPARGQYSKVAALLEGHCP